MTLPLLLFLILTLLVPYLVFTFRSKNISNANKNSVIVVGHRGLSGYYPENTLLSFEKAIEIGADMLELDVHVTKDDSVVVMHDYSVSRTTNGNGEIGNMDFDEIRALDAGSWFNEKFKNEKVPTLNEVLQLVNGRKKVLVELKWPSKGLYKDLVKKVIAIVRQHHAESWVILQSFETRYLQQIAELAPDLTVQQLVFGKSGLLPIYFERTLKFGNFKPEPNASSVNIFYMYVTPSFLKQMHKLGKTVYAFTPNNENDMKKLIAMGIDGIITNYSDKAVKLLGR